MSRRGDREDLIRAVVAAWNDLPRDLKPQLMLEAPDLYAACAWLAAHETVRTERRR